MKPDKNEVYPIMSDAVRRPRVCSFIKTTKLILQKLCGMVSKRCTFRWMCRGEIVPKCWQRLLLYHSVNNHHWWRLYQGGGKGGYAPAQYFGEPIDLPALLICSDK